MTDMLFSPYKLGNIELKNRIVMAPLTRSRASDNLPNGLMAEYYRQRASAGLIISEGAQVSPMGVGYPRTPGLYSKKQTLAWRQITDVVHKEEGKIFAQLWHVGSLSHPYYLNGNLPLAPSAVDLGGVVRTANGEKKRVMPRAMTKGEIKSTIADFVQAAVNAIDAGFDGVEVHSSNGYLFHQFFLNCTNQRTDEYGITIENKTRILFELLEELDKRIDLKKVGFRFNPSAHDYHSLVIDAETIPTFDYIMQRLNDYAIAYVHVSDPFTNVQQVQYAEKHVTKRYRNIYKGTLITNTNYDKQRGEEAIINNLADLVAYGKPFISNPDLVNRFRHDAPLNSLDNSTFYTEGAEGYTDYPFWK